MNLKNSEMISTIQSVERLGYKLYSYQSAFDAILELLDENEVVHDEIEVYIFEGGNHFTYVKSVIDFTSGESISDFKSNIEQNIKEYKVYARLGAWSKKLFDYAKLNNFSKSFVIVSESNDIRNEKQHK